MKDKFNAFKGYAERYGVKKSLVHDIDEKLYINNTGDTEDMLSEN